MNRLQLIGNLGADPETQTFQSGAQLTKLRVATTERGYTTAQGQQIPPRTTWHDVMTWGALAISCANMLQKGSKVYVEGILHNQEVEKDGVKRTYWQCDAQMVEFLAGLKPKQPVQTTFQETPPPPQI